MPRRERIAAIVVFALAGLLSSCANDWRTDMWYSPSLRPEDAPRPPPPHSVAMGSQAPIEDRDEADVLTNPVTRDPRSVMHGAHLFTERCACCHGDKARGDGPVSKVFPPAPDLTYAKIRERSDGYMFATITLGGRAMPAQAEGLSARDRWDLVNFIRDLEASTPPAPEVTPAPKAGTP